MTEIRLELHIRALVKSQRSRLLVLANAGSKPEKEDMGKHQTQSGIVGPIQRESDQEFLFELIKFFSTSTPYPAAKMAISPGSRSSFVS
jgi:hypothetical protein